MSERAATRTRVGGLFNLLPQGFMQAVTRHDVGFTTENVSSILLHIHQFKEAELSLFVIEKQVKSESSSASPRAVEPNM
jgi:hypothetical protein